MVFIIKIVTDSTKIVISNFSDALSQIVQWVIKFAPLGIMGLVYETVATNGIVALLSYGKLLSILIGCMIFVALVLNPIIVSINIRTNPYPLVFKCLKESGITAFFTRSSAANIPVNMSLCERLGLDKDTYSVSIPLGATVNMAGVGFIIGVLQDSFETAINSSTDVLFTATAEFTKWRKEGKDIKIAS